MKYRFSRSLLYVFILSLSLPALAQQNSKVLKVKGKIIEASTGKIVTNAEIKVPGYSSAIAKEDGTFELNVPTLDVTIVFAAEGYHAKEVALCGRQSISVAMLSDQAPTAFQSLLLPEGEVSKNAYSNSVEQKENFTFYSGSSLEELLQREFGSLRVNIRSGQPGIGGNLYLRGYNSINGTSQPLIVLDGMIFDQNLNSTSVHTGSYSNPLSDIATNDIERIAILKDGSAIYGIKGANGVIMIETKRAKALATKVNAYLSVGVNLKPKSIPMLNAYDYRVFAIEQANSQGMKVSDINSLPYMNENTQYANYFRYHNNTDWQNEVFENSFNKNAYLTVSGGDNVAKYALSLGFANYQGILDNTEMTRLNTRFNADVNITRALSFSANLGFSTKNGAMKDDGINSYTGVRYLALTKSPLVAPYIRARYTGQVSSNFEDVDFWGKSNPLYLTKSKQSVNTSAQYRMSFSGKLNYVLSKAWQASSLFGVVVDDDKEQYASPDFGVTNFQLLKGIGYQKQQKQIDRMQQFFNETRIDLAKTFLQVHSVNFNAGFRVQTSTNENDYILGYNSGDDSYTSMTNSLAFRIDKGYKNEYRYASLFANAGYNYQKKYFINATLTADATSRFGSNASGSVRILDYPFALLPTVSGSWNVSSERFMKRLTFVDLLKIRASYTVSANDIFADHLSKSYYNAEMYVSNGTGLVFGNLGNPGLKWETVVKRTAGIDLSLFNERLLVCADYFNNETEDLIVLKSNAYTGLPGYYANDGKLNNSGLELSAQFRVINSTDWMWNVGASAAHYSNQVTALSDDIETTAFGATVLTRQGLPIGVFYGYKTNGIYSTTEQALSDGYSSALSNGNLVNFRGGDVRFIDKNNDKTIDSKDMQVIGDPNPDFTGNFHSGLTFKKWTLDLFLTYSMGGKIYNALRSNLESMSNFDNQTSVIANRWRVEGQETNIPRADYGDSRGNSRFSDRWLEDGSYLKLKEIALSYTLPLKVSFIEGATIYTTAENLLTWTKYLGSDPEVSSSNRALLQGIDGGLLPQYRTITVGLKINL